MAITATQRDEYVENGYAVVPDVLGASEIAEARDIVNDFVERSRQVVASDDTFDLGSDHTQDAPRLRRLKEPVTKHPFFARLMRSASVLDAVAAVLGEDVRFHSSKLNIKSADGGAGVEWHQDFAFFPHTNDDLVACGIALDDSDDGNGCLLVIPGSHRGEVFDHHRDGLFVGAVAGDHPAVVAGPVVPVPVAAGSMTIHHVRLLHGSATNSSGRERRILFLQYAAADAFPLSYEPLLAVPPLETFAGLIVRGEQRARARLVDVSVDLPRFGGSYSSIYDVQQHLDRPAFSRAQHPASATEAR